MKAKSKKFGMTFSNSLTSTVNRMNWGLNLGWVVNNRVRPSMH